MRILLVLATLVPLLGAGAARADTLYDALGGKRGIVRIVDGAVALYMTDPKLRPYFDDINPDWLKPRFVDFLCQLSGGPCLYRGRAMGPSHRGLHIDDRAFNRVAEDLQTAMVRQDVPYRTQNRLLARLAPMERQIVTR